MGCNCQNEVANEIKKVLHEAGHGGHLDEICHNLKMLIGIQQRLLTKFEEAEGTPRAVSYVISQASPAQNTAYPGKPVSYDGVIRSLVVSGPGNVTVTLNDKLSISGSVTLAVISCNGGAVSYDVRHKIPLAGTLSIQTDSNAGTGLLALSAWIEPIQESNPEFFRLRR